MSNRTVLVNSAFSSLAQQAPSNIPERGMIYAGQTAICALTSKMYSGQGGLERAWSAIRNGTRAKLDAAIQSGGTAYLAFGSSGGMFLLPWKFVSQLTGEHRNGRTAFVVERNSYNSWCFVGPGGARTNIDKYRLQASTAEAA